jgi:hypothetical protein
MRGRYHQRASDGEATRSEHVWLTHVRRKNGAAFPQTEDARRPDGVIFIPLHSRRFRMRPRPSSLALSASSLAALLFAPAGCAQWSGAPEATAVPTDADLIVVDAERRDAASRAQAVAIHSFNKEALEALGVEPDTVSTAPTSQQ